MFSALKTAKGVDTTRASLNRVLGVLLKGTTVTCESMIHSVRHMTEFILYGMCETVCTNPFVFCACELFESAVHCSTVGLCVACVSVRALSRGGLPSAIIQTLCSQQATYFGTLVHTQKCTGIHLPTNSASVLLINC